MLVKMGVPYDGQVRREIRRTWKVIDDTFMEHHGMEAVLTSTVEGTHMPSSLHYAGLACDFRIKHLPLSDRDDLRLLVKKYLAERYGEKTYDVLFSANDTCLHVEYDPK